MKTATPKICRSKTIKVTSGAFTDPLADRAVLVNQFENFAFASKMGSETIKTRKTWLAQATIDEFGLTQKD